jgi:hypothetical protein
MARTRPDLTIGELRHSRHGGALLEHFGTWANALRGRRRGQRLTALHAWTKDEVIATLRARKKEGRPMNPAAIWRDQAGLAGAASRFFGSVLAAAAPSGARPALEHWDRDRLVMQLQALAKRGVVLTADRIAAARGAKWRTSLFNAAGRHFGAFSRARSAAGVLGPTRQTVGRGPSPG